MHVGSLRNGDGNENEKKAGFNKQNDNFGVIT